MTEEGIQFESVDHTKESISASELKRLLKRAELIQRPIVTRAGKAVLVRPTDKLAELGIE